MNEKLPPPPAMATATAANEDYRYELPYATATAASSAKASEATSGLYRYGTAASDNRAAVPTEYGGTLRSSKGGGGGGSSTHSRNQSPHKARATHRQRYERYCDCFGGVGGGGGGGKGGFGGHKQTARSVWPALLANLGICALLLGYIFIGSFVFLTIENSGENGRGVSGAKKGEDDVEREGVVAIPVTRHHLPELPQLSRNQQQLQQQHQQQQQQNQRQQPQPLQSPVPHQTAATMEAVDLQQISTLQHTHRDNRTTNAAIKRRSSSSFAFASAGSNAETYNDKFNENDDEVVENGDGNGGEHEEDSNGHLYPYASSSSSALNANVDYDEMQSLNMGVAAAADAQLAVDAERQRTVENIWDITVSLNILYKENWTKLAALEISKLQDQLVKRLVMDLTLSTTNAANGAQSTDTASVARGRSGGGSDGSNTMSPQTMSQNAKHLTTGQQEQLNYYQQQQQQQQQQQRQQRFGRLQHARQQLQQQHRHQQQQQQQHFEWNFATAFLYSLTVITTVGYGTISPRTTLGRMVTIAYATLGIPLTLIYLSSVGGILAKLARVLCVRTLQCCCCCRSRRRGQSYCGFSTGSGGRQVSDRKCDLKLKQLHLQQQQQQQQQQHLPYCYVRPPASMPDASDAASFETSSIATTSAESRHSSHGSALDWTLLAPVSLCLLLLLAYVGFGASVIAYLEEWPLLDGVYFCCMSLTTIGFSDLLPGLVTSAAAAAGDGSRRSSQGFVVWFCAAYILSGLTLTSMCVNLLHEEILLRMRVVIKFKKVSSARDSSSASSSKERGFYGAPP